MRSYIEYCGECATPLTTFSDLGVRSTYSPDVCEDKLGHEQIHKPKPFLSKMPAVSRAIYMRTSLAFKTYVNLLTPERYSSGVLAPIKKLLKTVTNFPNTRSIRGRRAPAATMQIMATASISQPTRSVYVKTRYMATAHLLVQKESLPLPQEQHSKHRMGRLTR